VTPKGRAETPEQKRAIVERLYAAWLARPHQRLGQLVDNAVHTQLRTRTKYVFQFDVEDETLVEAVEKFAGVKP
jgi:hypothetical protein